MESQPLRMFVLAIVWLIVSCGPLAAETLRVPQDHKSIQAAIDAAKAGDTVTVSPGTYKEQIRLKKGVILKSEGDDMKGKLGLARAEATILEGDGKKANGPGVVMAEGSTLDGFTVTNVGVYDEDSWNRHHATHGDAGFYLGTTEVTQFQWQSVMGTRPWSGKEFVKEGKDYPASHVSWKDAIAFCKKLTEAERRAGRLPTGWEYRLPTEAQWEYACRAGSTKVYGIDDGSSFRDYAWHDGTVKGEKHAHQIGQKRANAYGLHDMHGNLWEWCQDYYVEALPGGSDPQGPSKGAFRICRGGGWFDTDWACRSARRQWYMSGSRFNFIGFRVSRVPSSQ